MRELRNSSTHSSTRHWMEVSGQLHAPVALSQGEESTVPTEHEAG